MSFSGFFGQFLLERGLVSRDQLLAALRLVEERTTRFGEMAVAMGMLSASIRDEVLTRQSDEAADRFGQVAVDMGVMRPNQVDAVLEAQRKKNLALTDAIVELGFLDRATVDRALEQFNDRAPATKGIELQTVEDSEHKELVRWTVKLLDQIAGIPAQPGACELEQHSLHAVIQAHAFGWMEFHLVAGRPLLTRLTEAWTGGWQITDELLLDALQEFLNTVVGKVFSASPVGRRVTVEPPFSGPLRVPDDLKTQSLVSPLGCLWTGFARGRESRPPSRSGTIEEPLAAVFSHQEDRRTALIIDESQLIRRLQRDMLEELGFQEVAEAKRGDAALELVRKMQPTLVTLDLSLPGANGIELLQEILSASPQTHVLVVTSMERQESVTAALQQGASGYLTKPLEMPRLQEALERLYLV